MGILKKWKDNNTIEYTKLVQALPNKEYVFEVHIKNGKSYFKNCKQYDLYYNTYMKFLKNDKEDK